jgi:hypothetical protein
MLFRLQIFKKLTGNDREWSNTWLYNADDLATALEAATVIGTSETALHQDFVTITRALASDTDPDTDFFATAAINDPGTQVTGADGAWLPLYNTLRFDINVTGGGRPSRKFYRMPIAESDQQAGFIDPTRGAAFQSTLNAIITAANAVGGVLVDPDGQTLLDAVVFSQVQMRQLHRKRKKATP